MREIEVKRNKMATLEALVVTLTAEITAAETEYQTYYVNGVAPDSSASNYAAYESYFTEYTEKRLKKTETEEEVTELKQLFDEIQEELDWEAEVARAAAQKEQKDQAYEDSLNDPFMYYNYIQKLQARIWELEQLPFYPYNREDAIERNRAALQEATRLYYGSRDVYLTLEEMKETDAKEEENGAGARDKADAEKEITKMTKDLATINTKVGELRTLLAGNGSARNMAKWEDELNDELYE
jgi:hypothetical protein